MTAVGPAVELHDVWRRYRVASALRPRGLRASISRDPLRRRRDRWMWALKGVDLRVHRGEALALIGRNGAGKSTLLRLVGGVGRPDRGTVAVHGRVGAMIDLGHELHGDLTGRQNAEVAAVVAGLTRGELRRRFDEIVAFADLAEFIDEPLRAYSDGMRARLAFSVVAHLDPDVLLVDEVLAVGDAAFQRRSVERIERLRSQGVAVVFVSHDLVLARRVCDRAVWLDHGEVRAQGEPGEVVPRYLDSTVIDPLIPGTPSGSHRGCIGAARILDGWGAPVAFLRSGDGLAVETEASLPDGVESAVLRVRVVRAGTGVVAVDTSTRLRAGDSTTIRVGFERLDLAPGEHHVEVGLHAPDWSTVIDEIDPVPLAVRGEGPDTAVLAPPHEWTRGTSTPPPRS